MEIVEEQIKFGNVLFSRSELQFLSKMCDFTVKGVYVRGSVDGKIVRNCKPLQKAFNAKFFLTTGVKQPIRAVDHFAIALRRYRS